jgi:hypothetical protein
MDYHPPWIVAHCSNSTILLLLLIIIIEVILVVNDVIRRRRLDGKRSCGTVLPFSAIVLPLPPLWPLIEIEPIDMIGILQWEQERTMI